MPCVSYVKCLPQKATRMQRSRLRTEDVSATSVAVIAFDIDQGNRSRIVEIDFDGLAALQAA